MGEILPFVKRAAVISHQQTPFGQPLDYEQRSVRPIPEEHIARALGEDYDEQECVEEMTHLSPAALIEWAIIALVIATTLYFSVELMRGVL